LNLLGIPKLREWDWIPHLLICFVVLGVVWFTVGAALFIVAGGDTMESVFGSTVSVAPARPPLVAYVLGVVLLVIPMVAVAATIQVIANERRWRRAGDSRAK
jgi:hypothetical protein